MGRKRVMPTTKPTGVLDYSCPSCQAAPGEPCRSRARRRETAGHTSRQDKLLRDAFRWNELHPEDPVTPSLDTVVKPDADSDIFADEEPKDREAQLASLAEFRKALEG